MKYATSRTQAARQTENTSPRDSSAGQEAISITPPEYGIDFVDQEMAATAPAQRRCSACSGRSEGASENRTGMPDRLMSGVEHLSGMDMSDVRVHYNSPKPAPLQASAYTQGTDIHVGPGQERHLPHEAWHVVQQKQGRVRPTVQLQGVNINDDAGLEREADVMGAKAFHLGGTAVPFREDTLPRDSSGQVNSVIQRVCSKCLDEMKEMKPGIRGRELLTHDLTHVVQQRKGEQDVIQRRALSKKETKYTKAYCGEYEYRVLWELDEASGDKGGYVVQTIHAKSDVKDKDGKVIDNDDSKYMEAWKVKPDKKVTIYYDTGYDDLYTDEDYGVDTLGTIDIKGTAAYYDDLTLPEDFKKNNPNTDAGPLPSTTTIHGDFSNGTAKIDHNLKAKFNCIGEKKKTQILDKS